MPDMSHHMENLIQDFTQKNLNSGLMYQDSHAAYLSIGLYTANIQELLLDTTISTK